MIITIHQPSYLPWLGYFEKISKSDVYVYLDSVQLEKNSYSCRNKIKTPQGSAWLTIPIKMKGHTNSIIKDVLIDNSKQWKKKHLKSIYYNYKKAPFFDELYPKLDGIYKKEYSFFSDLAYDHLIFWLNELEIKTKVIRSSSLLVDSKKSKLILDLCKYFKADKYISGYLGGNYLIEDDFVKNRIQVEYQNYKYPVYQQLYGNFIPHLSIIDFWMNSHENIITQQDGCIK